MLYRGRDRLAVPIELNTAKHGSIGGGRGIRTLDTVTRILI